MSEFRLKQVVTYTDCLRCQQCCKFDHLYRNFAPVISPEQKRAMVAEGLLTPGQVRRRKDGNYSIRLVKGKKEKGLQCSCLGENMACTVQERKPFDCLLYPFVLVQGRRKGEVFMAVDDTCPKIAKLRGTERFRKHKEYLRRVFTKPGMVDFIRHNPFVVERYQKHLKRQFRIRL